MAVTARNHNRESSRSDTGAQHVFASARDSGAVTASDSTVLDFDALYVGGTGNVVIKHDASGSAITYTNVPGGSILPVSGVRVMAATTATSIIWMKW
jgi:hypothetical protein